MLLWCHCNVKPHLKLNIHPPPQSVSNPTEKQKTYRDPNLGSHNAKRGLALYTSCSTVVGYSSVSVILHFLLDSEFVRTTHNKQLETQKPGRKPLKLPISQLLEKSMWLSIPSRRYIFFYWWVLHSHMYILIFLMTSLSLQVFSDYSRVHLSHLANLPDLCEVNLESMKSCYPYLLLDECEILGQKIHVSAVKVY